MPTKKAAEKKAPAKKVEKAEKTVAEKGFAKRAAVVSHIPKHAYSLVIVESPTKAKMIGKFLGRDFHVLSSFGHVRDLPKKGIGVDIKHGFAPTYEVPEKSQRVVKELQAAAKKADMVYFASDEDREGEAISWHLLELLDLPKAKVKRITFHEITQKAIMHAVEHPRHLDKHMVDAQQARRVIDRLVGYKLSPFLWHKVARGLSAGRVQSVIVRLIVEREREIQKFVAQEFWSVEAMLAQKNKATEAFLSKLTKKDGETLDKFAIGAGPDAEKVVKDLEAATWTVTGVEKKTTHRSPNPPFTTSTLQQEGNNRLGYSAKQTMVLAQQLYEGMDIGEHGSTGLITYMRTDSVNLAESFIEEARAWIGANAKDALPSEARKYKTKAKGAQEAHEAIRPTSVKHTPESVAAHLDERQLKLYTLIWQRAVASQMEDAEMLTVGISIDAKASGSPVYGFRATGSTIVKKGFLDVYETDTKETLLPVLAEGEVLDVESLLPKQHFTEPPPRYTEASLVKMLEENGIGRPSTYAPTITTVIDRGYVEKDGRKLLPLETAFKVTDILVENFPDIVDTGFTAAIEEDLDLIAEGGKKWATMVGEFYTPFAKTLEEKEGSVKKNEGEATDVVCEKCGKPMLLKFGRFGQFLACTGYPECKSTKQVKKTNDGSVEAEETPVIDEKCVTCGKPMMIKRGRFGPFLSCSDYPACKTIKSIEKKTGVKCPECKIGDIIEKKSRKGKMFFACNRYPECKTPFWAKPTGENCPKCGKLVLFAKGDTVRCSDKDCDYAGPAPMKAEEV